MPSDDSGGVMEGRLGFEKFSLSLACDMTDWVEGMRLRGGGTGNSRFGDITSGLGKGRMELCTQKEKCARVLRRFVLES